MLGAPRSLGKDQTMREFSCARVVTDAEGRTRFAETTVTMVETEYSPPAGPLDVGAVGPAVSAAVIGSDTGWAGARFHPAPARQLMVVLGGRGAITVSDGETREFGPGEAVLLEDTDGEGHSSQFFGETTVLVVRLGEADDASR
jgi:mannose-6-phosphate isomerase-like protein (cupin superfamily)